ncbi:hypothetical protein [Micromonospora sp. NPDC004551]|uniref:hypothetical protein n=1 Tax=Micromonospora sp. NPDC004551 TaxID=3154284 RepID=UPI0033A3BD4B
MATQTDDAAEWDVVVPAGEESYFVRFGSFLLCVSHNDSDLAEVARKIEQALHQDSRVAEVYPFENRVEWTDTDVHYPHRRLASAGDLLSGRVHLHTVEFSEAIRFKVSVPIKNQPARGGYKDITSDSYWAAWDGTTLAVMWPASLDGPFPMAGGHIVIDLLQDVVEAAGYSLYTQACSPGCEHRFAHRNVLVVCNAEEMGEEEMHELGDQDVVIERVEGGQPKEHLLLDLERLFFSQAAYFARYKNYARHIRDLEDLARGYVDELLTLNYQRIQDANLRLWRRVWNLWHKRKERRRGVELIAILWLLLARLEAVRRDWFADRRKLGESTSGAGNEVLFDLDKSDDDDAVTSQDFTFIRSAIQQSATRFDTRTMALATAAGGIAGFVGAILGAVLASGG